MPLLFLQDLRLGTASLAALDLENCSHLREVQLSGGGGGGVEAAALAASGSGKDGRRQKVGACAVQPATAEMLLAHTRLCTWLRQCPASPALPQALVLKGCTSLPDEARKRLREAVLGA